MEIQLEEHLHPRVAATCIELVENEHFQHAALVAMKQVEIALREKSFAPSDRFGDRLIKWVLGGGQHLRLIVPLGEDLQDEARLLFRGAFSYYRNYAAHDGAKIDERICMRILVIASELLDLIDASRRSFEAIGGVQGLIDEGIFASAGQLKELLELLDGLTIIEQDFGTYYEELFKNGFNELQQEAVFDLGFAKYEEATVGSSLYDSTLVGFIELTEEGKELLHQLQET